MYCNNQVRLNVISGLDSINAVVGVDLLGQSLLPAITDLAQDSKWRVRLAVIENTPMLAKQLGVQFFSDKLITLSLGWLADSVFSIRRAAAENLKYLTDIFGEDWARSHIIPRIKEMQTNAAFSKRMTALYAVQVLLSCVPSSSGSSTKQRVLSQPMMTDVLLPIVLAMAADPVPNIRFSVAKTLVLVSSVCKSDAALSGEVARALAKLSGDLDRDVRQNADRSTVV